MKQIRPPRPVAFDQVLYRSLFLSLIFVALSYSIAKAETYKVVRVVDGDTITILDTEAYK